MGSIRVTETATRAAPAGLPDIDPLLAGLRESTAARDRRGGHPAAEKASLRELGLLRLTLPRHHGGYEADWRQTFSILRRLAAVDSALAHLLAFHYLQLATVVLYGDAAQRDRLLGVTGADDLWWGNALNLLDPRLHADEAADGALVLDGVKSFCSGAYGSDMLVVSALHRRTGKALLAVAPTGRPGITVHDDWDPIGQRQTDSGSVSFAAVGIPATDVIRAPGVEPTLYQTLRICLGQLILVNLYAGIAAGALAEARDYVRQQGRPWILSDAERVEDDHDVQRRFGEMHLQVEIAARFTERAVELFDAAWTRGNAITPAERGAASLAIMEAKVLAHRASLFVGQEAFEATGARATRAALGLDRFWRNARTHTLHDPVDYKIRAIGRSALLDEVPPPSLYS
ncbi:MAG: acyl-CoA dehydrogenase family protein [Alphaproteobacteria bacterium]|nr:acyl-CoA dehydrogenase family protein [Alphaproteobacteria bacterium]